MTLRAVKALHPALVDDIGELRTRRPLPGPGLERVGAFLFLNHHGPQVYAPNNRGLPFGPHPHRGFETVTFIVSGELAHRDSAGHESVICAGGALEILQLWVNLPARLKMSVPRYVGLQRDQIPALSVGEGKVILHLIAGSFEAQQGPIATLTGVMMSTIEMQPSGRLRCTGIAGRDIFLYVVRGSISVGGQAVGAEHLVELEAEGDTVEIVARAEALLLFGHADPILEPVVAHGPFVMNSRAEIEQAIRDYHAGKFDALA